MEMTDAKVVEKKIYEDGKKEYASKGLAGTALGIETDEKPYYNDYALYVAMNQVVSDHGCTIAKILGKEDVKEIDTEHLVKYAHSLALDLLKDKDGVYNIREYFLK